MEGILDNTDILHDIIRRFNFKKQLELGYLCSKFGSAVKSFLLKNKYEYTELAVTDITTEHYLLQNNINNMFHIHYNMDFKSAKDYTIKINKALFKMYLRLIAGDIQKLALNKFASIDNDSNLEDNDFTVDTTMELDFRFNSTNKFTNLISITYINLFLSEEDLQLLATNCPQLEILSLDNCFVMRSPLIIGFNISLSIIQNMIGLKRFEYKDSSFERDYEQKLPGAVEGILKNLYIQELVINILSFSLVRKEDDENFYNNNNRYDDEEPSTSNSCEFSNQDTMVHGDQDTSTSHPCELLDIRNFANQDTFNKFTATILNIYENIQKLIMFGSSRICVDENFFISLSKTCRKLKHLRLEKFQIHGFMPLHTLDEIEFSYCTRLQWEYIKIMLSDMKLRSATFHGVRESIKGSFECYNFASTLIHLHVFCYEREHFKDLFEMNDGQNLKNLSSLVYYCDALELEEMPTNIATDCLKFKSLTTLPCPILIDNLDSLQLLSDLTLCISTPIQFSNILKVLKHPILKQFTLKKITGLSALIVFDISDEEALIELENLETNISFIKMPLETFLCINLDYWYKLLDINGNLIILVHFWMYKEDLVFLRNIVFNENIPERITYIKFNGYNVDLLKFKQDYRETINKIYNILEHYVYESYMMLL